MQLYSLFKYLKSTFGKGLLFKKEIICRPINIYSDVDSLNNWKIHYQLLVTLYLLMIILLLIICEGL